MTDLAAVKLIGQCDATDYPLQKKHHSLEYLREHMHMRLRTNALSATARVRYSVTFCGGVCKVQVAMTAPLGMHPLVTCTTNDRYAYVLHVYRSRATFFIHEYFQENEG